jgi:hypothetical protein
VLEYQFLSQKQGEKHKNKKKKIAQSKAQKIIHHVTVTVLALFCSPNI